MRRAIGMLFVLTAIGAAAQDDAEDAAQGTEALEVDSVKCLATSSVRRTKVVDDSTIAFFMRNHKVYVNLLPRRCPQLARNNRFAYEARGGRLCSSDTITVLLRMAGRLDPGFTCRLGEYHPSDEETVQLMIDAYEQGGTVSPVTAEPVELPPEEDEPAAESADP